MLRKLWGALGRAWKAYASWRNARARASDMRALAPAVRARAPNPDAATAFVMFHLAEDPAWHDASDLETARFLEACGGADMAVSIVLRRGKKALYDGP